MVLRGILSFSKEPGDTSEVCWVLVSLFLKKKTPHKTQAKIMWINIQHCKGCF